MNNIIYTVTQLNNQAKNIISRVSRSPMSNSRMARGGKFAAGGGAGVRRPQARMSRSSIGRGGMRSIEKYKVTGRPRPNNAIIVPNPPDPATAAVMCWQFSYCDTPCCSDSFGGYYYIDKMTGDEYCH